MSTEERRLTLGEVSKLPDHQLWAYLKSHPITGGDGTGAGADDDEDDSEDQDGTGKKPDASTSGKKKDGDKGDKLYTKAELDAITENAVKDRLDREKRAQDRKKAEADGDKDKLILDLKKEIDEELRPQVGTIDGLKKTIEELQGVVDQQIESILKDLPDDLKDLDLGEEVGSVKRLEWLLDKVVPKKDALQKGGTLPRLGNGGNPKPGAPNGKDKAEDIQPMLRKNRF